MNQKLLAVAVAGLFAAPAFAQTSNVTLYGRANLGVDQYKASGATAASSDLKSRYRIYDSGSRIGVRGIEDLGNGLRAVFQIESGVNVDNGSNTGQAGTQNFNSGLLASRDSFVGLDGGFGRVTVGRQSIWWANGTLSQTGANYINAEMPFLTGSNGRVNMLVARASDVLQYTIPTFGGFNATLSYSPNSQGTGSTSTAGGFENGEAIQVNRTVNAKIYGATLRWAGGPIGVQYDYAVKKANSDAATAVLGVLPAAGPDAPKNTGHKGLVGWTYMPGGQLTFIGTRLENANVAGVGSQDLKQNAYGLNWEHTFGNIQALAQIGTTGKVSGCTAATVASQCDNSKSKSYMVGARYFMSKRTWVYASYNKITNQSNAFMDYTGGNITSNASGATIAGADPQIIAVGVFHNF
ncbi:MAG: porin [Burkholderiales bacterium]